MTFSDQNTFLAASDAARFIMFAVLMIALLGGVGLASYLDERAAKRARIKR